MPRYEEGGANRSGWSTWTVYAYSDVTIPGFSDKRSLYRVLKELKVRSSASHAQLFAALKKNGVRGVESDFHYYRFEARDDGAYDTIVISKVNALNPVPNPVLQLRRAKGETK